MKITDDTIEKTIKITKIIFFISILAIIIFITINYVLKEINTNKFKTSLQENGFTEKKDNAYYKTITNTTEKISYKALDKDFIFSKIINKEENNTYTDITLKYTKNKEIQVELQYDGQDENGEYGLLFQEASLKNKKFKCKYLAGNTFKSKCNYIKKETEKFNEEINEIIINKKISPSFIKIQ